MRLIPLLSFKQLSFGPFFSVSSFLTLSAAILSGAVVLTGCTAKDAIKTPVNIIGMLFGAIPPPEQTTVLQELTKEYDLCVADGGGSECAQVAYSTVRRAKGLDDRPLPQGVVIVREDNKTVVEQVTPEAEPAPPKP